MAVRSAEKKASSTTYIYKLEVQILHFSFNVYWEVQKILMSKNVFYNPAVVA